MKKLLIYLISGLILNACAISRDTPAPIENITAPSRTTFTPPAVTAPAVAAASSNNNAPATATTTTINKINDEDEGKISQNSSTNPANGAAIPASNGMTNIGGVQWLRPTNGQIVQAYSEAAKGVNISGKEGQSIVAAADGKVVYSGNGLKGYGNLIIIKHQDNFLTAYSHNKVNLVKEGAQVKQGQKIAELGKTDSDKPILHFELRKSGKPQNPSSIFNN